LDDSIQPFNVEHSTRTGFKFKKYTEEALLYKMQQALHHYINERIWKRIQLNNMAKDFSWKRPAREYAKLYEAARVSRGFAPTPQKSEKPEKATKTENTEKIARSEKEAKSAVSVRRIRKTAPAAEQTAQAAVEAPQTLAKLH